MTTSAPLAANPEAYVPLRPAADYTPPAPVLCPSTTHDGHPVRATTPGTYLKGTSRRQYVEYCARCALRLTLAGLFVSDWQ